ncbi:hypothetical protein NONO_c38640 [Nocardia nova SH22a]|uniref:Secreted protein n=1 Tax=Nocardia nova SH22a TaxID=1415166 RepID=W5TI14_9NOCA|nr:hypothetical protein [Nocardia nova]AHH18648.1 hypothetical protein NONO_c38640 [Nocardia nova SH22a]
MRFTVRQGLAAVAISGAGLAALAPAAAAADIYHPVITPCSHLFRTPLDAPRPGTEVYWSPFGTADIVCYDDGTVPHYLQRDPSGGWHYMNEVVPGNRFFEVFTTSLPDRATWG